MRPLPEPILQRIPPTKDHTLIEEVTYHCWKRMVIIPAGFIFDKSSVPRPLHSLISPADLSDLAPLLHDWLYRHPAARHCVGDRLRPLRRKDVDGIFRDIMVFQGVNPIRGKLAYLAVRLFGSFAYQK